ncbi:hypothetical protein N9383_05740 [Granulosicoccus sp.]|nr:hypothetical protein [Granulosicoccus sp.]
MIAEKYYNRIHYAWCTPFFDYRGLPPNELSCPPSSTPAEIGRRLNEEIILGDRHSTKIRENKVGLIKGAKFKHQAGVLTDLQFSEIEEIVDQSEIRDFRPLLYVIPSIAANDIISTTTVSQRAHPLSVEYIISELPRDMFDVISFPGTLA